MRVSKVHCVLVEVYGDRQLDGIENLLFIYLSPRVNLGDECLGMSVKAFPG